MAMPEDNAHGASIFQICIITAFPAVTMSLGSAAVSAGRPSERLQARMQHLSAGLLIGAVTTEIFPILRRQLVTPPAPGDTSGGPSIHWLHLFCATLGFGLALVLMYSLKSLAAEGDEDDEDPEARIDRLGSFQHGSFQEPFLPSTLEAIEESSRLRLSFDRLQASAGSLTGLVARDEVDREAVDEEIHNIEFLLDSSRRVCRGAEPIDRRNASRLRHHVSELIQGTDKLRLMDPRKPAEVDGQLQLTAETVRHIHSHAERATFRRWAVYRPATVEEVPQASTARGAGALPLGMILAVIVDSAVDGMLIGLAGAVASASGWLLAMATAIEMGFLGYSFACSLTQAVSLSWEAAVILMVPPLAMLCASVAAYLTAYQVQGTPIFSALIAFALAAVLFLVLQELLLEAHEKQESEGWTVSVWLYIGLLMSICIDIAL
ncbi:unnamed protein product [Polarella glacialis]|uniref:Uncharacterized protein n=1 Tax=Polarella glacialis TaxID=89957 RepID=A0A813GCA0_POLGL|nr:unnamed protein product [Polarella glacialis]